MGRNDMVNHLINNPPTRTFDWCGMSVSEWTMTSPNPFNLSADRVVWKRTDVPNAPVYYADHGITCPLKTIDEARDEVARLTAKHYPDEIARFRSTQSPSHGETNGPRT